MSALDIPGSPLEDVRLVQTNKKLFMSACRFTIDFTLPVEDLIAKTRSAIESQGGSFNGDSIAGSFTVQVLGSISGSYLIAGKEMTVDIHSKPLFITCNQIENFMKNQFGS